MAGSGPGAGQRSALPGTGALRFGPVGWAGVATHILRSQGERRPLSAREASNVTRLKTFSSARAFREWLEGHHETTSELLLRCYKSHAGDKGLTYPEAVEEALCFGWIDGVRRSVDSQSFSVRFTPRKSNSTGSAVNIRRAREHQAKGRMHPASKAACIDRA